MKAKATKNAERAKQYLRPELAARLRAHLGHKTSAAKAFGMPRNTRTAAMLHEDLDAARQAWLKQVEADPKAMKQREESDFLKPVDSQSLRLDFHSLRHTTGTWLARAGMHPKRIQRLMRHSTIRLTMDTYGHLLPDDESDTVNHLPPMPLDDEQERETVCATGPYDVGGVSADCWAQLGGNDRTASDSHGQRLQTERAARNCLNRENMSGKSGSEKLKGRGRIRTDDGLPQRICNPLP